MAMAMAPNSSSQSSADDVFSDSMELARYLHRRVEEIGKQSRFRTLRITASDKEDLLPGLLQGLPCPSESLLKPSRDSSLLQSSRCNTKLSIQSFIAHSQKTREPAELGAVSKSPENCSLGEESALSLDFERLSSKSCFVNDFLPGLRSSDTIKLSTKEAPLALRLPSLQDHTFGDAEAMVPTVIKEGADAGTMILTFIRKGHEELRNPKCYESIVDKAQNFSCGNLETDEEVLKIQESCQKQVSMHTQDGHALAMAEVSPNKSCSISCQDNSECCRYGDDAGKGHVEANKAGLQSSKGEGMGKSEEADTMRKIRCLEVSKIEEDDVGTNHLHEEKWNSALDLLLDAIEVTSEEEMAVKEFSFSHGELNVCGSKSSAIRSLPCASSGVYGDVHSTFDTSLVMQDHEGSCSKLHSIEVLSSPIGRFSPLRKRSSRHSKLSFKDELYRVGAVKYKSLQAVSEAPDSNIGKKRHKAEEKLEREKTLNNGKRERAWEKQPKVAGKATPSSMHDKRAKFGDGEDMQENGGPGQMQIESPQEEQVSLERKARPQVLPTKFADSIIQPWKKNERKKG